MRASEPHLGTARPGPVANSRSKVVFINYALTEECGGPGLIMLGFAEALARAGHDVTLIALDNLDGHWLTDERRAAEVGYRYFKIGRAGLPSHSLQLLKLLRRLYATDAPDVVVSCGLWGAPSLALLKLSTERPIKYVVRPAGSLGRAALEYKRAKKLAYYGLLEGHALARSAGILCMSEREREELPKALASRAAVVPAGIELPTTVPDLRQRRNCIGILARLHPIKRHHMALDAVEALVRRNVEVQLEFAGDDTSQADYVRALRSRIAASPLLRERVRFHGHVRHERLAETIGHWRAALLLSEQENFGHSVITTASLGIPTIVASGVGLASDVVAANAGARVSSVDEVVEAVLAELENPVEARAESCRRFARQYSWERRGAELMTVLREFESRPAPARGSVLKSLMELTWNRS